MLQHPRATTGATANSNNRLSNSNIARLTHSPATGASAIRFCYYIKLFNDRFFISGWITELFTQLFSLCSQPGELFTNESRGNNNTL